MRIAFDILAPLNNMRCIELFDAATCCENPVRIGTIVFTKKEKTYVFESLILGNGKRVFSEDASLIRKLSKAFDAAESKDFTPLVVVRAMVADRGVQVVYDSNLKKLRCCSTMQEGADTYELVGTILTVDAKDADQAVRLGKKEVTAAMEETPENAAALVKFFTGGCKVKKLSSGKLPSFIMVAELAQPGEEKLASTIIKIGTKDE